jgi:hypothetical protein
LLGVGEEEVYISEEDRENHMHIVGTTGVGKSRFLEHLMRMDIDRGIGFCFLDPSFRGNTMKRVLAYCAKVGYSKVLVIDPNDRYIYDRICPLNLFSISEYKGEAVAHAYDIIKVLFDMKNEAQYAFIQHYLPSLLGVLFQAGLTVYESIYFTDYANSFYQAMRLEILERSQKKSKALGEQFDSDGILIEGAFRTPTTFREFGSTIRRMDPLNRHETLKLMFGAKTGIDFSKIIKNGWVVLVNLHRGRSITGMHSKLLATTVINEIISSMLRMADNGWKGRYYLYIDEAGEYANDKLKDLLYYYRQSGLGVTFAHQLSAQFGSSEIKDAVQGQTKIKVAFYQPSHTERMETAKTFFGGDIPDREASDALKNLKKQQAVIMGGDRKPKFVRIPDVDDVPDAPESFIRGLYSKPWYRDPKEVSEEIKARLNEPKGSYYGTTRATNPSPKKTSKAATGPDSKVNPPRRPAAGAFEWEDTFNSLREDPLPDKKDDKK